MKPSKFPQNAQSRQWTLHEATAVETPKLDPCLLLTSLFDFLHGRLDTKLASLEKSDQTQKKRIEDCQKEVRKLKAETISLKEEQECFSGQSRRSRTPGNRDARAPNSSCSPKRKTYSKCGTPAKEADRKKSDKKEERPPWVSTRQIPARGPKKEETPGPVPKQPARAPGRRKQEQAALETSPEPEACPVESRRGAAEKPSASNTIDIEIQAIPTFQESSVMPAENFDQLQQTNSLLENLFDMIVKPKSVRCDHCGHCVDLVKALSGERLEAGFADSRQIPRMAPSDFIHIANANSVIVGSPRRHDTFNPAFSDPNSLWVEIERKRQELLLLLDEVGSLTSKAYTFRQDSGQKPRAAPSLQVQPVLVTKCDNIGPASNLSSRHSSPAKTARAASPAKRSTKVYEGFEAKVMKGGRASSREDGLDCRDRDRALQEAQNTHPSLAQPADPQGRSQAPRPHKAPGQPPTPLVSKLPPVGYQSPYKAKPEQKAARPQKENRQPHASDSNLTRFR